LKEPSPRVLIADDDADVREALNLFLTAEGYAVRTAEDGCVAVAIAQEFRPEIVFMDVWMPHKDGIEACLEMREGPCPPPVPIYGVTADVGQLPNSSHCFDRVLLKPLQLEVFIELVNRWVVEHRRERREPH
jgi:CheY-like chemotaxis protein